MERNTKTTINELQPGDRFYFISDTKRVAYQVVSHTGKYANYNIVNERGESRWQYDRISTHLKQVMFLRNKNNSSSKP